MNAPAASNSTRHFINKLRAGQMTPEQVRESFRCAIGIMRATQEDWETQVATLLESCCAVIASHETDFQTIMNIVAEPTWIGNRGTDIITICKQNLEPTK